MLRLLRPAALPLTLRGSGRVLPAIIHGRVFITTTTTTTRAASFSARSQILSHIPPPSWTPRSRPPAVVASRLIIPRRGATPHQCRPFGNYDPEKHRRARPLYTPGGFFRMLRSPSTHMVAVIAVAGAVLFYFSHLETVPVSGRTRFNVYSSESIEQAGEMQCKAMLYDLERQGARILPDFDPRTIRVKRVLNKLVPFSGMADQNWEIFVVDEPRVANAFVLPGGKVFVFSGILPIARNDSGLATILGHEIAHNLADHVGERMSQAIGTNMLLYSVIVLTSTIGLGLLLSGWLGSRALEIAFGHPMSRKQESEADYIGLMMMAEACYDPHEAARFWARMDQAAMEEVPEWLSTHPSNENRIKKIQEWLPKALEKRAESDCSTTTAFADRFRQALLKGVVIFD
ncbi:peptidase family M48-domain-containing protein [Podospora appendiculata]|uniref:Peptidase family M48-domain-containing protein n=1 Tax=Podospora appendiculata TaxID=314037 RepID=A0AAE1C9U7_9PEZI|nr:peptidase family M48-domain-containing protein [Podospora appendiculata]